MNAQALASQNLAVFIGTDSGTFYDDEVLDRSLQKRKKLFFDGKFDVESGAFAFDGLEPNVTS